MIFLGISYLCIYLNLFDVLGVGTHMFGPMFLRTYDFWINNRAECWLIFKYSFVIYVTVCAFFPCDYLLSAYLPFCFLSYLDVVFNSFRIHTCYALAIVSDISQIFILKLIWNSSCCALYWWIVHVSLLSPENQWMTVIGWLSCLCWDFVYEALHYLYLFWLHYPMVICVLSAICIT